MGRRVHGAIHLADFVRVDDDSFRVTCRESKAVALFWPHYCWGGKVAVWEVEPPTDSLCHDVEHVNANRAQPQGRGEGRR